MLIGIIKQGKEITGDCKVVDTILSHNSFRTVMCEGVCATSADQIIYLCERCKQRTVESKRSLSENKGFRLICRACNTKITNLQRYGVESTNQLPAVKARQQGTDKTYVLGNNYQPNKTHNSEELSKLRSEITKERWLRGTYDNSHDSMSAAKKLQWQDSVYVAKVKKGLNNKEVKHKQSVASKKQWAQDPVGKLRAIKSGLRAKLSKIHRKIKGLLELDKRGFVSEQIVGKYVVDELNEETKVIIEVNGDYVHANPNIYKEDDIIRLAGSCYSAKEKWIYDNIRTQFLQELGYRVIVLWESDLIDDMRARVALALSSPV